MKPLTKARAAQIARLHASRRGRRVHPKPPPEIKRLARSGASLRQLAAIIGVHDRTMRQWIAGIDYPAPRFRRGIVRAAAAL
jgi:hypothetical protein